MTRQTRTILGLGLVVLLGMAAAVWMVMAPSSQPTPEDDPAATVDTPGESSTTTEPTGRRRARREGSAVISGDVRLSRGDQPAAGQVVVLELEDAEPWTVPTDASGAFRFEKLPGGGPYEVRVTAEGFATVRLPGIALDRAEERELGTLWLDAAVRAEVRVRSLADAPIEGAEVLAFAAPDLTSYDWSRAMAQMATPSVPVARATTDAEGSAVFPELAAGSWTFTAEKDGYAMRGRPAERLRAEEERAALTIYLGRGYRLSGRVTNQDGKPVAAALLLAAPPNMAWSPQVAPLRDRVVADEAGRYAFTTLASGNVVLWAGLPDGPVGQVANVVVPSVGEFDVVLRDGGVLRGKVTLRDTGEPVAGARVRASSWGAGGGRSAEVTTDEEGAYVIDTLSEGTVNQLTVEKEGMVEAQDPSAPPRFQGFPLRHGETVERNLELAAGGVVAGVVSGPSGPLGGVRVTVISRSPTRGLDRKYATTDDAGRYEVTAVKPGNALVQADKPGFFQPDYPAQWWMALNQREGEYKVEVEAGKTATLDIALRVGAVVEGAVQMTDGTPVGGARITAQSANMIVTFGARTASATSQADGTFRLEGLAPVAQARLTPAKAGLGAIPPEPVEILAEQPTTGLVLQMETLPRVRGTVLSASGEPVEDAHVQVTFRAPMENGRPVYFDPGMMWTQAQRFPVLADGTYDVEIRGVRGSFWVRAGAPELAGVSSDEQKLVEGQSDYEVDLAFAAGDRLAGRVVVKDGDDPVAGAHVTVTAARSGGPRNREMAMVAETMAAGGGGGIVAVTDSSGGFEVRGLAKGSYRIGVTAHGYVAGAETADVPAGAEVRVELAPELELSGLVVYGDGRPVEGAQVTARGAGSGNARSTGRGGMVFPGGRGGRTTTTDPHGRFVITGLPGGSYELAVSAAWGSNASVMPFTSEPFAAGTSNVRLTVRAGLSLTGRVLGPDGKGVANAMINANPEERKPGRTSRSVQSSPDGSFTIGGLAEGLYTLNVNVNAWSGGEHYQPATRTGVAAGTTGIEIALESGLSITGLVVDEEGRPMQNAWVQALPIGDGDTRPAAPRQPAMLDAKGRFELGGLQAGRYSLRVNSFGRDGAAQMILVGGEDVAAGTTGLRLTASKGGTISGKVVNGTGEPIARARVQAQPAGGGRAQSTRTRPDGTFELGGLTGSAAMTLTVRAEGFMPTTESGVAVGDTVELQLRPGLRAQGVVLGADGAPLARARIEFRDGKNERVQRATTNEKGEFDVGGLPEGTFTVRAWLQQPEGGGWKQQDVGTIRAGDAGATLQVSE